VGADGATHHGVYDLSFLRSVPQLTVASPMDEVELRNLMYSAQLPNQGAYAIRYPRGAGSVVDWQQPFQEIKKGTARKIREGKDLVVLSIGPLGVRVQRACEDLMAEGISVAHYDMRFVKPLDEKVLHEIAVQHKRIITIEEGTIVGGLGSAVLEFLADHGYSNSVKRLGIPDRFVDHGSPLELYREVGLDRVALCEVIRKELARI